LARRDSSDKTLSPSKFACAIDTPNPACHFA
jgi:hypothetical protein